LFVGEKGGGHAAVAGRLFERAHVFQLLYGTHAPMMRPPHLNRKE
jgi:hypothetical protein